MPGRYFLTRQIADIASEVGAAIGQDVGEQEPRFNVSPGQDVVVFANGALTLMRWGILPVARKDARGRPVMKTIINARSETLFSKSAFEGVSRCVVPADGWYEWTGETRKKTAWRIRDRDGRLLWFAAVSDTWTGPGGLSLNQVATVTCEPNADVKDIHHRMGVLLHRKDIETWLDGTAAEVTPLMRPYPEGLLIVEQADDVDWSGA